MVMNNQPATSSLNTQIHLSEAIRSRASEQADKSYSAALSHQQSYSEAMSAAERGVYEASRHQGLSEASGSSFVTSQSASDMQALNDLQQDSHRDSQDHSASESASHNRQFEGGVGIQAGLGAKGGVASLSASGDLGAKWSWSHNESEQRSFSQGESATHTTGDAHNVESVFRGVAEGHYRANTEEGQRILNSISSSLDRAHQEQQQASAQFQQADTYRKMTNISEEQAETINSNATQNL